MITMHTGMEKALTTFYKGPRAERAIFCVIEAYHLCSGSQLVREGNTVIFNNESASESVTRPTH